MGVLVYLAERCLPSGVRGIIYIPAFVLLQLLFRGHALLWWLRHYAAGRKVADSRPL
jgi:hypothetical protein